MVSHQGPHTAAHRGKTITHSPRLNNVFCQISVHVESVLTWGFHILFNYPRKIYYIFFSVLAP